MKTTTEKAVVTFRILNNAKLGKMKDGDKFLIVRMMKQLRPIATSYDDFLKDAGERLRTEGVEEVQAKVQSGEKLTQEEQNLWNRYNSNVAKCVQEELQRENEFDFQPLSEEGFKGLIASNDFSVAEIMVLDEVISE